MAALRAYLRGLLSQMKVVSDRWRSRDSVIEDPARSGEHRSGRWARSALCIQGARGRGRRFEKLSVGPHWSSGSRMPCARDNGIDLQRTLASNENADV